MTIIKYCFYTSILKLMSIAQATHVEYERGDGEDEWVNNLFYDMNMKLLDSYTSVNSDVLIPGKISTY
jgi:hypothetical protein